MIIFPVLSFLICSVILGRLGHNSYGYKSWGFPGGSAVKNPPANAGDTGSIPGPERPPGERNGNPLQYSCRGNLMGTGAWRAAVQGAAKESDRT